MNNEFEVNLHLIENPQVKPGAYSSINVRGVVVSGIKVATDKENPDRIYVNMPQYKNKDGEYKVVAFIADKELKQEVEAAIRAEFTKKIAEKSKDKPTKSFTTPER